MHENFIALETEKRDRIINSAMREFAANGFKKASTNVIAKNAGIPKSLLFYYFSSKEDLFRFLYKYRQRFILEIMEPYIKDIPTDVFERLRMLSILKLEIAAQHPDMSDFKQTALRDNDPMVQEFLKTEVDEFSNKLILQIYDGVDMSKFKPEVDVPQSLKIIWWTLEGFGQSKLKEPYDPSVLDDSNFQETLLSELDECLGTLKKMFYKEEYL